MYLHAFFYFFVFFSHLIQIQVEERTIKYVFKYLLNKDTLVKKRQTDDFAAFINKKKAAYSTLLS